MPLSPTFLLSFLCQQHQDFPFGEVSSTSLSPMGWASYHLTLSLEGKLNPSASLLISPLFPCDSDGTWTGTGHVGQRARTQGFVRTPPFTELWQEREAFLFLISRGGLGAARALNTKEDRMGEQRKTNVLLHRLSYWIKLLLKVVLPGILDMRF